MKQQIRLQLDHLREEIDALPENQDSARSQLTGIVNEIESELDSGAGTQSKLMAKIQRIVGDFEVQHPRATSILNDISLKLASMGI